MLLNFLKSSPPSELADSLFRDPNVSAAFKALSKAAVSEEISCNSPRALEWRKIFQDFPELSEVFKKSVQGKTLIDLAAGTDWQLMYEIAKDFGASKYVAVDKFFPFQINQPLRRIQLVKKIPDIDCPALIVKGDALEFLGNLLSQSACVCLNSFDFAIVHSPEYHMRVACEIERVVPSGGITFGILSTALSMLNFNYPQITAEQHPISADFFLLMQRSTDDTENWINHSPNGLDRVLVKK